MPIYPDKLEADATRVRRHLPDLFRYATQRADTATNTSSFHNWDTIRQLTASLIGAMNRAAGFREPTIEERTPAQAFREILPELPRLLSIAHHAAVNARAKETQVHWVRVETHLHRLQQDLHAALQAENVDDAIDGLREDLGAGQ